MYKICELTILRKIAILATVVYVLTGFWEGYFVVSAMVGTAISFFILLKPNPDDIDIEYPDDNEEDEYTTQPTFFNQHSSSGSSIWTDHDEHISK